MCPNTLSNEQKQGMKIAFDSPQKLEWVVREDPRLQAELNRAPKKGKEVSSQVVNKVVDRIKSL
jgi:hypothetical protein